AGGVGGDQARGLAAGGPGRGRRVPARRRNLHRGDAMSRQRRAPRPSRRLPLRRAAAIAAATAAAAGIAAAAALTGSSAGDRPPAEHARGHASIPVAPARYLRVFPPPAPPASPPPAPFPPPTPRRPSP